HVDPAFPMRWPFEGNETDWQNWDTDGDGVADGVEVALGTNPLDPDSPPSAGGQIGVPVSTPLALALLTFGIVMTGAHVLKRRRANP
ncbi:MAG TPA: thrombospondin type 3 repeat-containing protein, partial [Candidatus Hydrogenedentes bacterium]|nr:thrombospondin type 3 repeat-containing protein [Candidatus Hydrogenedentota bacterium]